jgi:hypothetical protein
MPVANWFIPTLMSIFIARCMRFRRGIGFGGYANSATINSRYTRHHTYAD